MKRVLFVDDETRILEGIKRMLRPLRKEWEVETAEGGPQALTALDESHFDVIVSDMRMPGMDGAELLRTCKESHPEIVRIVLSGHMELESVMQSVAVAHQFLTKPCEAESLRLVLTRAGDLKDLLEDPKLRSELGDIHGVPVLPKVYLELTEILADEGASLGKIAELVESSPMLTAKVLQLVNSAFVGLPQGVNDLTSAVRTIGINMLRNLVIYLEVVQSIEGRSVARSFDFAGHQRHSTLVARLARDLVDDAKVKDEAFTAGMLHDIGKVIVAVNDPEGYDECTEISHSTGQTLADVEYERWSVSHAEIGAYLLGLWGLPHGVTEAVAYHHRPARVREKRVDAITAVHVADALLHEAEHQAIREGLLDDDYLSELLLAERLTEWRGRVAVLLENEGEVTHV